MYSQSSVLQERYKQVRALSEEIVSPLEIEDLVIQSMPDVSPPKWHLAHTTWFFETFILIANHSGYSRFDESYDHLFNSYYETHGKPFPRQDRGLLGRPTVDDVFKYRHYVDQHILEFVEQCDEDIYKEILPIIEIGLHHEQQHQELLITDIKYNFSINPLKPLYKKMDTPTTAVVPDLTWIPFKGGLVETGHSSDAFAFDNEGPLHKSWLEPFALANRPVTNEDYILFMNDGGYQEPAYWLSEGWGHVKDNQWHAPLYWEKIDGEWFTFTLSGMRTVELNEPVTHISYYEADAFARWAGCRLPTETEWEHALKDEKVQGNFLDCLRFHPSGDYQGDERFKKGFGDVWEWTMSPYSLYPRSKQLEGTLGEYNAKFMSNQMVLRGGSCATHSSHIRLTYRNFFHPDKRWQHTGIRLAKNKG